ncbi:Rne/Rng family ribonuclease [Kribbella pratensis]|uniref:Ribonuclease E n=1 Tax=Kribbella pratensis TaxID=2512112 RepID=A0A4R8CKC3_9ACTN|nr:Rne/Rng family ribonuclease [Kribbella pratensis]TDW75133.1 ribonuclease E [Kribbella pratensis]
MLDNEPTTEAADAAATAQPTASTRRTAKKAPAAKKTTTRKRTVKTAPENATAVPTQSDGQTADPAPEPVKKAAAKKTAAKKTTAKKAAAKAPAKKTARAAKKTAEQDIFPQFVPDDAPETADAAPAKKTTRKRAAKKAAGAPDLLSADSPVSDGPVANADTNAPVADASALTAETSAPAADAPARKRTSRRRTSKSAEAAPAAEGASADHGDSGATRNDRRDRTSGATDANSGVTDGDSLDRSGSVASSGISTGDPANATSEEPTTRRTRRRAAAPAAVLFQAPTGGPQQTAQQPAPQQSEPTAVEAAAEATPEPGTDEQPTGNRRRRSRRNRDAEARETEVAEETTDAAEPHASADASADASAGDGAPSGRSRSRSARKTAAPAPVAETATDDEADEESADVTDAQSEDGEEGGEGTRRRRRRRGGRRRRKTGEGADDNADDQSDDEDEHDTHDNQDTDQDADASEDGDHDGAADSDEDGEAGSSSRRRRRRRRRKGEDSASSPDDPDETVVRVREPRSKNTVNEITAVEGSTRLEAKKQRRREGRAAGRRRAPIVTEAEFLARRESVERTMVIRSREDLTQIAVSEDNVLVEHYVTTAEQSSLIGNVYLGRVQNVLPSMEAAFIDIGKGRNAVLYAGEVDWATLGGANGPRKIEQVLKSGQSVLVQVTKDPIGHKGARLTNQISLPGRYVVYVPRGGNGGISRKLPDTERNRLKTILKDIVPDEAGVIVRTAAEGASEEELTADVSRLQKYWEDIDRKSKNGQAPQLLHGEPDLLIRVVRDLFTEDFTKLVISGDDAFDQVREYVADVAPHLADRVEKWSGDGDVFANFRIDEQIKKALDRKVWLPSGGSLIIDRTEAMTVVDVNTGKFTGSGGNLEETVTKNNLEAAEEIVRQLRLRDIGGIIVIDFIDMVLESNRDLVLRRLVECLGRDRTKHQVAEVTSLGLVQMTRKRIGTGLLEAFSENCDHCGGRGLILHDEPKESRRRDSRNGQGNNGSNGHAQGNNGNGQGNGNSNGNGHDHGKPAQAEEGGRKSSRRRRGKGRGEEEAAETGESRAAETAQHNADAAQKLALIAAASAKKDDEHGTPEPTGYPISAAADEHVSPEATGFPAETAQATTVITETPAPADSEAPAPAGDAAGPADAAQNGATKSTRRRRSSRSRSKTSTEGEGAEPSELVTTGS